ncbi:ABC transporter permease subunit, partial [Treponema pallidum]
MQTGSPITPFFLPPGTPGAARFGALFAQSVFQALCSAVLACAVGFGAAFFFVKRSLRARALFPALCAIPLAIPPLTMALAFLLSFGKNGLCTRTLGTLWGVSTPRTFLYSASGVVIAHAWYNFPLALAIIARAWNTISADAEDAARLLGARAYRVFYTITLPALAGALRSSFLVIFLYCFFSLMMVLLLGGTTF